MSALPSISVVIATRNRAQTLRRTLEKLFESGYPDLEVIVVDGASTDGTVDLLRSYENRITRWVSEPDEGEYWAYNKGIRMATGEIVKLMSDDDVLRPKAFRLAAEYFTSHPETDIVFGQTVFWVDSTGSSKQIDDASGLLYKPHERDESRLTLRHWLRETTGVHSLSAFIRRRVFEKIGPLSTDYVCGDIEFWGRAALAGIRMGMMPQEVVDYHMTGLNGVTTKRWKVAADMVRINVRYGTRSDVLHCWWRFYVRPFLVWVPLGWAVRICHRLGLHPLRAWRRLRPLKTPER